MATSRVDGEVTLSRNLVQRLVLEPVGQDRFVGRAPAVPARIYGGELAAQTLAAANATVADDRVAHSLQCTYLAPGDPATRWRTALPVSETADPFRAVRSTCTTTAGSS